MNRIISIMTVVIFIFSLVGCGKINMTENETETSVKASSLEDYSCIPICYSINNESYWMFINAAEKTILAEQIKSMNSSFSQWNSLGAAPAYFFYREIEQSGIDQEYYRIVDIYNSEGYLLGRSYESYKTGGLVNGSAGGYAIIHTRPDNTGTIWSIVIDEKGNVLKEVPNNEYIISSWNPEGYSLIIRDGLYEYIDTDGQAVIDAHYKFASQFDENGLAAVWDDDTVYLIDTKGNVVMEYEGLILADYTDGLLICISPDTGKYVIADENGHMHVMNYGDNFMFMSAHKFEDGTILAYCVDHTNSKVYLINVNTDTFQTWDDLDVSFGFNSNDTIIMTNTEGYQGIYDKDLNEIIAPKYRFLFPLLGGNYYSAIWGEKNSSDYYVGIIDTEGDICVYTSTSKNLTETYEGEDLAIDYKMVYTQETAYNPGNSAWGTACFGIQSLLSGDVEDCLSVFQTGYGDSMGGTEWSRDQLADFVEMVGENLEEDYGNYHVSIYFSICQDVTNDYIDSVTETLNDSSKTVEEVRRLTGNYQVKGSEDYDDEEDLEDNEFEVTVVCVDGDWFLWSF